MTRARPRTIDHGLEALAALKRDQALARQDNEPDHALQQHLHGDGASPAPAVKRQGSAHAETAKTEGKP